MKKIAAIQLSSQDDLDANLAEVLAQVRVARDLGADLVVLPEGFAFLGKDQERARVAERLVPEAPIFGRLSLLCREFGISIIAGGMAETSSDPQRPYNTSAFIDRSGTLSRAYRKVHLFDVQLGEGGSYRESSATSPGTEEVVVDFEGTTLGLSICFDLRFPEVYARHRALGASVLTVPAAFTQKTGEAHWHVLLKARAIETQCWVVAAAQEGTHPGSRRTYGHSLIIDPWGRVVAERTLPGPGVIVAEIDEEVTADVRARMPLVHVP